MYCLIHGKSHIDAQKSLLIPENRRKKVSGIRDSEQSCSLLLIETYFITA